MNDQGNTTILDDNNNNNNDNKTDTVLVNASSYNVVDTFHNDLDILKGRLKLVYAYATLSIAIIGVLGNIVTIIVFQKGRRCGNSWCAFYFKALAVADIYVLLSSALQFALDALGYIEAYGNKILCTYNQFNFDFCVQVSTWITVTITIDRAITVSFPMKARNIATRKWMGIKLAVIVLVFTAVNLVVVFKLDYETYNICTMDTSIPYYIIHYVISEGVLVCVLPATINIVCNLVILRTLYRRASNATQMGLAESHVTSRRGDANSVMYRVLAIGVVHLLSTFPMMVSWVIFTIRDVMGNYQTITYETALTWSYVGMGAFFLTSGVNFVFYGMVGTDFRRDLKDLICVVPARGGRQMSLSRNTGHLGGTDTSTV